MLASRLRAPCALLGVLALGAAALPASTSTVAHAAAARSTIVRGTRAHHGLVRRHRSVRPASYAPATATAAFGLDLMPWLGNGNVVFSPDSIETALAMAGTGARGATAAQMANVLRLRAPSAFASVGDLQSTIAGEQRAAGAGNPAAPTLDLADALFLQERFALAQPFVSGLEQHFGAAAQTVDFEHDAAGAVQAINAWVSANTQGLIPQIVSQLEPSTRLALANAVYLKANWLHPFKASATASAPFHGEHATTSAPLMNETEELRYDRGPGYAAVELPYSGSTLSLDVLLPEREDIAALQRSLDPSRLAGIFAGLSPTPVQLSLPRFHIVLQTELGAALKGLGMTDAFSETADFSGITTSEPVEIGQVDHAANFTVEEEGTTAAAATIVTVEASSARAFGATPVVFDADRPFLFFLRDDRSGAILFAGRLADASEGGTAG
jgi:serpin B